MDCPKELIDNAEAALWKIQEWANAQDYEAIPGYIGTCRNRAALNVYQLRIQLAEKFPRCVNVRTGS